MGAFLAKAWREGLSHTDAMREMIRVDRRAGAAEPAPRVLRDGAPQWMRSALDRSV